MFCQKCGNKLEEGQIFCPVCGKKVNINSDNNLSNNQHIKSSFNSNSNCNAKVSANNNSNMAISNRVNETQFKETIFFKMTMSFFRRIFSFSDQFKNANTVGASFIMGVTICIIYGILNMFYQPIFTDNIFKGFLNSISEMNKSTIVGSVFNGLIGSSDILANIPDKISDIIKSSYNKSELFFTNVFVIMIFILITFVALEVLNQIVLGNSILHRNILLISIWSYIPVVIMLFIASIVVFISNELSLVVYCSGFLISLLVAVMNIRKLSNVSDIRVCIIAIVLAFIMAFFVKGQFSVYLNTLGDILNSDKFKSEVEKLGAEKAGEGLLKLLPALIK